MVIAAVAVAVLAVVGVLAVAALSRTSPRLDPVAVVAIPAPAAGDEACRALLDALPDEMADYRRAELVDPAPEGAAAWRRVGSPEAGDPVIMRCGLDRPREFVAGSPVQMVDDVAWFRIPDTGRTTWVAVDRPVVIALTLPDGSGPSPIQLISRTVAAAMPAVPVRTGPPG